MPNRKLTIRQVRRIRKSTEKGVTLASRYGVMPNTIYRLRSRRTWKYV